MPLKKIQFAPGLNKDDSPLASEGGWIDANWVRFVRGSPQSMGGWQASVTETFAGIARGAHAWATMDGHRVIAWGTAGKLYALIGGDIRDITPLQSDGVLASPFTTTTGSNVVVVAHTDHGLRTGQDIVFSNQSDLVSNMVFNGSRTVTVLGPDSYQITADGTALTGATGGGAVDYSVPLAAGLVDGGGELGGYGSGSYGEGGYGGDQSSGGAELRVWFLDNWGETLVALPRGGALYQFQPALSYPELVSGGSFNSSAGWTVGADWSIGSGVATAVAGSSSDLSTAVSVAPGYVYRVMVSVTRTAGSLTVNSNVGSLGSASNAISITGTYSRRFRAPAGMTELVITKDTTFEGSIDNVSVKLESVAYWIDEAPIQNSAMFVDPHQIVVLLGTNPYLGDYNPMTVRWCDRQNLNDWVPTVANLAGDDVLSIGSRLVAGLATRQQNLIWSDAALYTMQFTGDASMPFVFALSGTGCGLIGALAHTEHNGRVFWVGNGRFYSFDGGAPTPVSSALERDFFDHIAENQAEKIVCGILPKFSEVWVLYPDGRDGSECSRYVTYRWDEAHWTAGLAARSSWVDPGLFDYPIMFGTDGVVYEHEVGNSANGDFLDTYLESAYFDIDDGDNLAMIRRIIGDFDDLDGYVDFTIYGLMWPSDDEKIHGPFQHTSQTKKIDLLMSARQIKIRLSASSSPLFWRLSTLRLDLVMLGEMQ